MHCGISNQIVVLERTKIPKTNASWNCYTVEFLIFNITKCKASNEDDIFYCYYMLATIAIYISCDCMIQNN